MPWQHRIELEVGACRLRRQIQCNQRSSSSCILAPCTCGLDSSQPGFDRTPTHVTYRKHGRLYGLMGYQILLFPVGFHSTSISQSLGDRSSRFSLSLSSASPFLALTIPKSKRKLPTQFQHERRVSPLLSETGRSKHMMVKVKQTRVCLRLYTIRRTVESAAPERRLNAGFSHFSLHAIGTDRTQSGVSLFMRTAKWRNGGRHSASERRRPRRV